MVYIEKCLYICTVVSSEALTGYKGGRQTYIERDVEQTFYLAAYRISQIQYVIRTVKQGQCPMGLLYTYSSSLDYSISI